jgi:hypothetical protein
MIGRWANLPAPTPTTLKTQEGAILGLLDIDQFNRQSFMDIYPGDKEPLDIAVRFDEDAECYAWNNDAYIGPQPGRNPNWRLDKGVYLAQVTISISGRQHVSYFRIHNEGLRNTFRLERPSKDEIKKIKAAQHAG